MKVTGGDCQEMLKLLPLGVNLAAPGMVTGGVAYQIENRESCFERIFLLGVLSCHYQNKASEIKKYHYFIWNLDQDEGLSSREHPSRAEADGPRAGWLFPVKEMV